MRWITFDANNPPELNKKFLVYCGDNIYYVAKYEQWSVAAYTDWFDCSDGEMISAVTHYAEIERP